MSKLKKLSKEEFQKHNSYQDCWIALHGHVIDVTKFLIDHPGGEDILADEGGTDATEKFEKEQHSETARKQALEYKIGILEGAKVKSILPKKKKKSNKKQENRTFKRLSLLFSRQYNNESTQSKEKEEKKHDGNQEKIKTVSNEERQRPNSNEERQRPNYMLYLVPVIVGCLAILFSVLDNTF